ncbi:hypothetical protein ABZ807_33150, partial [Micromonospora sp. NPDC047548]|uniref:hypothetical protein n=1 Tax=Micromonospora sp. NPDC047548 TaxID=3155624 RepID=UPI0033C43810
MAPVKVTVPVAGLPPVKSDGFTDTDERDGPGGVAAFTERFAVRGMFWTAAVIWTIAGGAAALVAMVNVTVACPAGTTTDAGTVATAMSLLRSSTVVAVASGIRVSTAVKGVFFRRRRRVLVLFGRGVTGVSYPS